MSELERTTQGPIFILTAARCGSTLLRFVLDSHPAIACPAEANLSSTASAIQFLATNSAVDGHDAAEEALALCREVADRTIGNYARRQGKRRWCDKSLTSADQSELLREVFPDAQFICLYRECMDTIASLVEASTWSFGAFGIEPYVRLYPSNVPLALGAYWADKVEAIQVFEAAHPESCFRIKYEDLAHRPDSTIKSLMEFLALKWSDDSLDERVIFGRAASATGPGDFKIRYTSTFHTDSIGRGWRVPIDAIPPPIRERINRLSTELGYPVLEAEITESIAAQYRSPVAGEETSGRGPGHAKLDLTIPLVFERVAQRVAADRARSADRGALKVVLADDPEPYIVDFLGGIVERGDRPAACTLLTDSGTLLALASGSCNPGTALRQASLRLASESGEPEDVLLDHLDAFVDALAA